MHSLVLFLLINYYDLLCIFANIWWDLSFESTNNRWFIIKSQRMNVGQCVWQYRTIYFFFRVKLFCLSFKKSVEVLIYFYLSLRMYFLNCTHCCDNDMIQKEKKSLLGTLNFITNNLFNFQVSTYNIKFGHLLI